MGRKETATMVKALRDADRVSAEDNRSRRQRIAELRRALGKVRQTAKRLERELRGLGERETTTSAGIDWNEVYDRLRSTFMARQMSEMTGARAGLVASIVHRWKAQGRIVTVRRGTYRKALRRR